MNSDTLFYACITYLLIAFTVFSFMPSSFARTEKEIIHSDFLEDADGETISTATSSFGYFTKMFRLMIIPMSVSGIPLFFGAILTIINVMVLTIAMMHGYNLIRGRG